MQLAYRCLALVLLTVLTSPAFADTSAQADVLVDHTHAEPALWVHDEAPLSASAQDFGASTLGDAGLLALAAGKSSAVGSHGNLNFWHLKTAAEASVVRTGGGFTNDGNHAFASARWDDHLLFSSPGSELPSSLRVNFVAHGNLSVELSNEAPLSVRTHGRASISVGASGGGVGKGFVYTLTHTIAPNESPPNNRTQDVVGFEDYTLTDDGTFSGLGSFDVDIQHTNLSKTEGLANITVHASSDATARVSNFYLVSPLAPPVPDNAAIIARATADFSDTFWIDSITLLDGTPLEQVGITYTFGRELVPEPSTLFMLISALLMVFKPRPQQRLAQCSTRI